MEPSVAIPRLSSIPLEHFLTLSTFFYCTYSPFQLWSAVPWVWLCKALYMGSVKRWHWGSTQEDPDTLGSSKYKCYVLHLSNEPFPENVSDLEGVKNHCFPLMYPDFNVWKKVGNRCFTVLLVLSCTPLKFPTFFQTLKSGNIRG